jgi:hypothetical protein
MHDGVRHQFTDQQLDGVGEMCQTPAAAPVFDRVTRIGNDTRPWQQFQLLVHFDGHERIGASVAVELLQLLAELDPEVSRAIDFSMSAARNVRSDGTGRFPAV